MRKIYIYIIYLVKLKGYIIKVVEEFGYLGLVLQEDEGMDVEMEDVVSRLLRRVIQWRKVTSVLFDKKSAILWTVY